MAHAARPGAGRSSHSSLSPSGPPPAVVTTEEATAEATTPPSAKAAPRRRLRSPSRPAAARSIYAVEADTASPWLPSAMVCAAACHSTVGRTIYEPLAMLGDDGQAHPYLLESFTPNDDFTVWTLVVREGIKFHDGTDLNADAVAFNLATRASRSSLGAAVAADPRTGSCPTAPSTVDGHDERAVAGLPDLPQPPARLHGLADVDPAAVATTRRPVAAHRSRSAPGPFQFESYESGDNGRLTATRFEDYWRGDGPNSRHRRGPPLPRRHRGAVHPRQPGPQPGAPRRRHRHDPDRRTASRSTTSRARTASSSRSSTTRSRSRPATCCINHMPEVGGAPNPFSDVRVRQALALRHQQRGAVRGPHRRAASRSPTGRSRPA